MTSSVKARNFDLTPDATLEEIFATVISGSVGTSEGQLLKIIKKLPKNSDTQKLLTFCVMASMNVKKVTDESVKATGTPVPDTMMTGDSINMSVFAQIGHLIMITPDSYYTTKGRERKEEYRKSIGGASDIRSFNAFREPNSIRADILSKYRDTLSTYNHSEFRKEIVAKYPIMFTPSYSKYVWNIFTTPFSLLSSSSLSLANYLFLAPAKVVMTWTLIVSIIVAALAYVPQSKSGILALLSFVGKTKAAETSFGVTASPYFFASSIVTNIVGLYSAAAFTMIDIVRSPSNVQDIIERKGELVRKDFVDRAAMAEAHLPSLKVEDIASSVSSVSEEVLSFLSNTTKSILDFFEEDTAGNDDNPFKTGKEDEPSTEPDGTGMNKTEEDNETEGVTEEEEENTPGKDEGRDDDKEGTGDGGGQANQEDVGTKAPNKQGKMVDRPTMEKVGGVFRRDA